jgi:hypothetical protein
LSISRELKRQVAERAKDRCEYCRCPASHSPSDFSVEHIYPQIQGGSDDLDNLAWSCQGCNQRKFTAVSGTDPMTAKKERLFHPRLSRWEQHFEWSEDTLQIVGKTPTGRTTTERLKLNRFGVVNLLRSLLATNEHPPKE